MVHNCSTPLVILLCLSSILATYATGLVHKRFEYKLSFKGPHLVQRDGTVPFWEHGGAAIASDESVRITPSLRSKKGFIWSKNKNSFDSWEIEVIFKISGRGRIGADGLAIWYTAEKGTEGPVFGSNDNWNGLGVFFDSFDNDAQHNNPYILVMTNDGTKTYDHASDGQNQQLGGCLRDYRNKPYPIHAKIEYYQNALTLFVHNGMTNNPQDFELCMRVENVHLPSNGHFGVTAATGGLADDHDVLAFLTHSFSSSDKPAAGEVSDEEKKKYEQEFDDYHEKLERAKEEYRREHPDKRPEEYEDGDKYFESQDVRELKMIFDGQNQIHNTMRILHQRLDEMIGRQERTLSQISSLQVGAVGNIPQGQGHQQGQLPMDSIKRFEVDTLLNTQRELQSNLKNIQNLVSELSQRSNSASAGGVSGYDGTQHYMDVKSVLDGVQRELRAISNKPQQGATICPEVKESNCVTTFYLVMFLLLQIMIFIAYSMYRSSKDASAKKFY